MRSPLLITTLVVCVLAGCSGSQQEEASDQATSYPPVREAVELLAECMQERGWDVEVLGDGRLSSEWPSEQADQAESDYASCEREAGLDKPRPPRSKGDAEAYFDALLEAAECVRSLGYDVEEPPSREFAVEELQNEVTDLGWDPYTAVDNISMETIEEVYAACPPPE